MLLWAVYGKMQTASVGPQGSIMFWDTMLPANTANYYQASNSLKKKPSLLGFLFAPSYLFDVSQVNYFLLLI